MGDPSVGWGQPDVSDSSIWWVGEDQARVCATLVSAFADDPFERWLYPAPQEYHPSSAVILKFRSRWRTTAWRGTRAAAAARRCGATRSLGV